MTSRSFYVDSLIFNDAQTPRDNKRCHPQPPVAPQLLGIQLPATVPRENGARLFYPFDLHALTSRRPTNVISRHGDVINQHVEALRQQVGAAFHQKGGAGIGPLSLSPCLCTYCLLRFGAETQPSAEGSMPAISLQYVDPRASGSRLKKEVVHGDATVARHGQGQGLAFGQQKTDETAVSDDVTMTTHDTKLNPKGIHIIFIIYCII